MLRVLTDDALCLAGHDWIFPEFRCSLRTETLTGAPSSSTMKIGIIICACWDFSLVRTILRFTHMC